MRPYPDRGSAPAPVMTQPASAEVCCASGSVLNRSMPLVITFCWQAASAVSRDAMGFSAASASRAGRSCASIPHQRAMRLRSANTLVTIRLPSCPRTLSNTTIGPASVVRAIAATSR